MEGPVGPSAAPAGYNPTETASPWKGAKVTARRADGLPMNLLPAGAPSGPASEAGGERVVPPRRRDRVRWSNRGSWPVSRSARNKELSMNYAGGGGSARAASTRPRSAGASWRFSSRPSVVVKALRRRPRRYSSQRDQSGVWTFRAGRIGMVELRTTRVATPRRLRDSSGSGPTGHENLAQG